jgi:hypothetical protein
MYKKHAIKYKKKYLASQKFLKEEFNKLSRNPDSVKICCVGGKSWLRGGGGGGAPPHPNQTCTMERLLFEVGIYKL